MPLADVVVSEDEIRAISDVYRSGWLSMGPETAEFETEFAEYVGARHALAVTNGTAGLHLICLAAGFGPGDEVIVPSMTFVATANAVAYTGATPVFADIASLTEPSLSCDAVESAITPRTAGVVMMSYGGHPGKTLEIEELARSRGLCFLEDAAHAVGALTDGRSVGTIGQAGAYSFFSNKNLAVGEGGMIVTDDDDVARQVSLLRSHGMTSLTWDRHRGHASTYDVTALGFNYRIDEPRAALGRQRLARLDADNAQRARLDMRYREQLPTEGLVPALAPVAGSQSAHHLFTVVLDSGTDRAAFREFLAERGIQTSLHYPPAHRFAIYSESANELPVTDAYGDRAVTLPLFASMTEEQQDAVVDAARQGLMLGRKSTER